LEAVIFKNFTLFFILFIGASVTHPDVESLQSKYFDILKILIEQYKIVFPSPPDSFLLSIPIGAWEKMYLLLIQKQESQDVSANLDVVFLKLEETLLSKYPNPKLFPKQNRPCSKRGPYPLVKIFS